MDNQIPEDPYRILARERSHEDARQTVATNRMLVQSLVIINGGAATAVLAYSGAHNASGPDKLAALLTIILYCLGVFTAIFAGLYVRRTTQEWSSFWELKSYPDMAERERVMEGHRQQAINFLGYHAAVARLGAARAFGASHREALKQAIETARTLAREEAKGADAFKVLGRAERELVENPQ
jgi:hypothetical protein